MHVASVSWGIAGAALSLAIVATAQAQYSGGSGTADDPYLIYTAEHLNALGAEPNDYDKHFRLMADIDLSRFDGKDGRPALKSIGSGYEWCWFKVCDEWGCGDAMCGLGGIPFTGVFDGNGHTITNLVLTNDAESDCAGLFAYIDDPNARITDLRLVDPTVAATCDNVGCLVGYLQAGTITRCAVENARVSGNDSVGCLVGVNSGTVTGCGSTGTVTGYYDVAGLVGSNGGTITASYSTGSVAGHHDVAGLVGSNGGTITASYSTGSVAGHYYVAGLVGGNHGTVIASYSSGTVTGHGNVGGLVGFNGDSLMSGPGTIVNSYSRSIVSGEEEVGGLVGYNTGTVRSSFWDIQTSGLTDSAAGTGLATAQMQELTTFLEAGWDLTDEAANGTCDYWKISSADYPRLRYETDGGLVMPDGLGTADQPYLIQDAYDLGTACFEPLAHYRLEASIDLSGVTWSVAPIPWFDGNFDGNGHVISNLHIEGDSCLGLFGQLGYSSTISDLGLEQVDVHGTGDSVGGLAGYSSGAITACCSAGMVTGKDNVGGLVGINRDTIVASYSTGSVAGHHDVAGLVGSNGGTITASNSTSEVHGQGDYVGGLAGSNGGTITASNSTSEVHGQGDYVGGFVGSNGNGGTITTCYSAGMVTGEDDVGGLVGINRDTIVASYSRATVTGQETVGGLVGYNLQGDIVASHSSGPASGKYVGGLVGHNWGTITTCYSTSAAVGTSIAGGLAGANIYGSIATCYSAGTVTGKEKAGGLVASNSKGSIATSFWDTQTSSQANMCGTEGGEATGCDDSFGRTTAEMQAASTFREAGWDFIDEIENGTDDIWWILEGQDYPRLWWELPESVEN